MEKREYEYLQARFSTLIGRAKEHYFSNNKKEAYVNGVLAAKSVLKEVFSNQKEADVAPVRHGKWYGEYDGYADGEPVYDMWFCSECGWDCDGQEDEPMWKYCPNCGAEMDGEGAE